MKLFRIWVFAAATMLASGLWAEGGVTGRVNINTADAAALSEGLDGIGEARAQAIVRYREANGAFSRPDDLTEVSGIGTQVMERNRGRIDTE